jgi:DNA-directed RNA polymerase subunit E'
LSRVVAVSYKSDEPKIGLTMRQPGLGKLEWVVDDKRKSKLSAEKAAKVSESGGKKKKKE